MAIAGLGFLAISMVGAVMLIANYAFSETLTVVSGIVAFVIFGGLWYVAPARPAKSSSLATSFALLGLWLFLTGPRRR